MAHHLLAGGLNRRRTGVGSEEVGLGREAHHTTDRPHDLGGQYGTDAVDVGESGSGTFYLGFDALVWICDLSISSRVFSVRSCLPNCRRATPLITSSIGL